MTRRWLVLCGAVSLSTALASGVWSQTPSSLAERIQQLRRELTEKGSTEQPTAPTRPKTATAAPSKAASTPPRGLPQIDARSLLPTNLSSRTDIDFAEDAGTAHQPTQRTASRTPLAAPGARAGSPSIVGEHSTARPSPSAGAARQSPPTRSPIDFEAEDVRDELTGVTQAPSQDTTNYRDASPEVLDDFAAGLAEGATSQNRPAAPTDNTSSTGPISLPISPAPATLRKPTPTITPDSTIAEDERYAQPSSPAFGEIPDRSGSDAAADNQAAAKAFQFAPEPPTTTVQSQLELAPLAPRGTPTGPAAEARRESFAESDRESSTGPNVLVTNQSPAITSDIRGPKQIAVGREASYRVRLQNQGGSAAEAVVATVRIPAWAEVVNTTATSGVVRQTAADDSAATLEWQISQLDAQASETLSIDLIPRASRPLELGVAWTHDPVNTRTIVEVQEPKLHLQVTGPDEVLFGKSHVYRLTLSNPGTGVAENVRIELKPPGGGEETVSTYTVGNLAPGASKTAEVELTAREAGKLSVEAVAVAEGDLRSVATKELFCRKPELEVDWRGPEMQYAGTAATYFFRVRNPGTAAADDVTVRVSLPEGAEFVSASEGHVHDSAKREVAWRVGSLGPGDDCYMELRSTVTAPGENKLAICAATADGGLVDNKLGITNVVALADLKLDVSDPPGPVAVGEAAIYEIRITNRGASAAEEINVVGLFSAGLEPETVEGAPYTASDGRVAFRTIHKLPAGQNVVLQIHAKATEAGTHVFRAEVLCRDLEIKLAAEETTRFYDDNVSHDPPLGRQTAVGARYEQSVNGPHLSAIPAASVAPF